MGKMTHSEQPVKLSPEDLYSKLYRIADHILKENNPCGFEVRADGVTTCVRTRKDPSYDQHRPGTLCCSGCKHLGPYGCTVESLGCKLAGCGEVAVFNAPIHNKAVVEGSLRLLVRVATEGGVSVWGWRQSKDEFFAHR